MNSKLMLLTLICCLTRMISAEDGKTSLGIPLDEHLRVLDSSVQPSERTRRSTEFVRDHWVSSLQVKTIASRLADDSARLEFALAAYPRTLDPENFYEVYDAFTSFSKVFRLHDGVRALSSRTPFPEDARAPISNDELKNILKSLRKESFEPTRMSLTKQILSTRKGGFLANQVKQILETFTFEPSRLEIAKFAYAFTLDRENYFEVNDVFTFSPSKEELAKFIESSRQSKRAE